MYWMILRAIAMSKNKKQMVTTTQLSNITNILRGEKLEKVANGLNAICPMYGISTADILHEFIANVLHESGEFNTLEENLNYKATALISLFGRHRISEEDAYKYGRTSAHPANKVEIANRLYGGQWGKDNLGNLYPMDGWLFRGSGPIQITGRSNVTKFTQYYNTKFATNHTPEEMAALLREDIDKGIHSACWIFAISKQLIDEAINDDIKTISIRINGGLIGFPERLKYYELAKEFIT